MPASLISPLDADLGPGGPATGTVEDAPELDLPEVWGQGSFPASDPPANW